jgi:hypothetical protein
MALQIPRVKEPPAAALDRAATAPRLAGVGRPGGGRRSSSRTAQLDDIPRVINLDTSVIVPIQILKKLTEQARLVLEPNWRGLLAGNGPFPATTVTGLLG